MRKKKQDNKGFTLIELVIVVAILAILIGILAPQYTKYVEKARKAADASNMDEMVKVVKVYAADPANELPAGIYTIKISDQSADTANDVTVTATAIATGATAPTSSDVDNLKKELEKSIPSYKATRTKSKKWKDGESSPIYAIVKVGEDGGTSVQYSLTDPYEKDNTFEKYMTTGSEEGTK